MSMKPALMSFLFAIFALLCTLVSGAILEKRFVVVLGNPDGASEPALRGGGAPSEVPHEATLAAPTMPATPAPAAIAATAAAPASIAIPPTSATPSLITPAPTSGPVGPPGCVPYSPCNLFYQSVNVNYWPKEGPFQNDSACPSAHAPVAAAYPGKLNIQSPSVLVIFPSIVASDGCSQIGKTFADLTTSFAPGALSTIGRDQIWSSFNFDDLLCPPAHVGWDPASGPYAPQLAPPSFLFHLDPAFISCIPGSSQGIDPYYTLTTAKEASGFRHRRALQHAHRVPRASQKKVGPI